MSVEVTGAPNRAANSLRRSLRGLSVPEAYPSWTEGVPQWRFWFRLIGSPSVVSEGIEIAFKLILKNTAQDVAVRDQLPRDFFDAQLIAVPNRVSIGLDSLFPSMGRVRTATQIVAAHQNGRQFVPEFAERSALHTPSHAKARSSNNRYTPTTSAPAHL